MNMNAYRIDTVVNPDGTLFLKDVPFQPVEEFVREVEALVAAEKTEPALELVSIKR